MNTRRKFLISSSMATAAALALKPFSTLARVTAPFTDFSGHYNKLVFLHTARISSAGERRVINYINDIKNRNAKPILLHAGQEKQEETSRLTWDVKELSGDYEIVERGGLRTGIISAGRNESDIIRKINTLSAFLKKEKKCTIVVCLSQLGYKNNNATDDITLATQTTHLDIIIGGHPDNFTPNPMIVLNGQKEEVIIHSASGDANGFGKIEFGFDAEGRKKELRLDHQPLTNMAPDRSAKVA